MFFKQLKIKYVNNFIKKEGIGLNCNCSSISEKFLKIEKISIFLVMYKNHWSNEKSVRQWSVR